MTPLHLGILLHYHTSPDDFELVMANETRRQFALELAAAGLLHSDMTNRAYFGITEMGRFYIEHLLSTPFPVEETTFHIPDREPPT